MGEFAKWAILGAAILVLLAAILSLPIFSNMDNTIGALSRGINEVVNTAGSYIYQARGFANLFVFPQTEWLITLVIVWILTKPFHTFMVNALVMVYHWIFK